MAARDQRQLKEEEVEGMNEISIKATVDGEDKVFLPFEVSDTLAAILTDQREKLDQLGLESSGKKRYLAAKAAGCLSAVAKGLASRSLGENGIFIHHAELAHTNGKLRISGLKTSINGIPSDVNVRGVVFTCEDGAWSGELEVVDKSYAQLKKEVEAAEACTS